MNTCKAIIPWDKLQSFVVGEESMRDFPWAFNEVHNLGYKEGIAENAKKKIKFLKNKKIKPVKKSYKRLSKLHHV